MKTLSNLFIIFGILWCLLGGYYFWLPNDSRRLTFHNYQQPTARVLSERNVSSPERIIISDLGINLPIIPAKIKNNTWETTNDGVSYLVSSPLPGKKGNSIVYGHNWASLFGNLTQAHPGQKIEIVFADGTKKNFVVEYTSTVKPTEASILAPSNDQRITLYTCTGFLDSKRFVVVAILDDKKASFDQIAYE